MGLLAESPDDACLILYIIETVSDEDHFSVAHTKNWRNGMNHLVITFRDSPCDGSRHFRSSYNAMYAASHMVERYYRPGWDISLPLATQRVDALDAALRDVPPEQRKYLLSFKGTVYLQSYGTERRWLLRLHNGEDVVVVEQCAREPGQTFDKQLTLLVNRVLCDAIQPAYDNYSYSDLKNTTFALAPLGRQPATYRLAEVLNAGAIPVVFANNYILPFSELIDWSAISFSFETTQVDGILPMLRAVPPERLAEMQRAGQAVYQRYFGVDRSEQTGSYRKIMTTTLTLAQRHVRGRMADVARPLVVPASG